MSETVFTIVTVACLFLMFRSAARKKPGHGIFRSWQAWMVCVGSVLFAVPGIIFIAGLGAPSSQEIGPGAWENMITPAGEPASLNEADVYLVRGVSSVVGVENYPINMVQAVLALNEEREFCLDGGGKLRLSVLPGSDATGLKRISLRYVFESSGGHANGTGCFDESRPRELEQGYQAFYKGFKAKYAREAAFGSLFVEDHTDLRFHIFVTPLKNIDTLSSAPADAWWKEHGRKIRLPDQDEFVVRELSWQSRGSGTHSGLSEMGYITGWSVLFILIGSICLLTVVKAKIRLVCCIIIYTVIYTGSLDSLALRIVKAHLIGEESASAAHAAIETAGTRLHPITAAQNLIEAACAKQSVENRVVAINCLNRSRLLDALSMNKGQKAALEELASDENPEIAAAADSILNRISAGQVREE